MCNVSPSLSRAVVTQPADGGRTTAVRFVDFGNSEFVKNSCIKVIPKSLLNIVPIAIRCSAVEEPLTSMSPDEIFTALEGKQLTVSFSKFKEPYEIKLINQDGKEE